MIHEKKKIIRHAAETGLLQRALEGDPQAANNVIQYLSSTNPYLRGIMLETLHDLDDPSVWRHLLRCLALQAWDVGLDCDRRLDPQASQRIDSAICEAFTADENGEERALKETILKDGLAHSDVRLRHAAAYLIGLRGDSEVIPFLAEAIESGEPVWKLRAVQALGQIKDERSGPPLLQALIGDRSTLHHAAQQSLHDLGPLAQHAWLLALECPDSHIRWHAARGLGEIGNAHCVELLAEGLYDENAAVRWASARVLARLDRAALPAILSKLSHHRLTGPAREAVIHALNAMVSHQAQELVRPLLAALHSPASNIEAPAIAQRILVEDWKVEEGKR